MANAEHCVIVGASHAGAQIAVTLRQQGWAGGITIVGDEEVYPYHRPPLSKAVLAGEKAVDDVLLRPKSVYETASVSMLLGRRVEQIDRKKKHVYLDDGSNLHYDKLVLCTGAAARQLPVSGATLHGVYYLRTIADVIRIKESLISAKTAVVIGGGYIGLETAAQLRKLGLNVTIVEAMERVLQRVTTPELSDFYARVHREEGVQIVTGVGVNAILGRDRVQAVALDDGSEVHADIVVVGIGVMPATDLAEAAGLEVDDGVVVNEFGQSSDPDIFAAGDCTRHFNSIYQRWIRLESVQNALDQATIIAKTLAGRPQAYKAVPWFWSDQFDVQLKIAGLSQHHDQLVIRGDLSEGRSFSAFYFRDGVVIAVDAVNRPKEFMLGKKLVAARRELDPSMVADESISAADFL